MPVMSIVSFDEPLTNEQIQELAENICFVNPKAKAIIKERLSGDQSEDFYKGMLAGFQAMINLQQNIDDDLQYARYVCRLRSVIAEKVQNSFERNF